MDNRELRWLRDRNELVSSLDDLEIVDAAGECLAPAIPDGAELFIDAKLEARSGDYVLLKMPYTIEGTDIDTTVKQLLLVQEKAGAQVWVIKNSAGMFRLVDEKILGVVVAFIVTPGRKSELGHLVDAANQKTIDAIARMRAGA